ncbi:MAG: hypothetical protein ACRCXC_05840 [Legionella sp.]
MGKSRTFFAPEAVQRETSVQSGNEAVHQSDTQKSTSWCNFFTAATVTAVGIGGAILLASATAL